MRRGLWVSTLLLLLIAGGLALQWPTRSLWYDETVNAYFAGRSWSAIWEWCTRIDNQVPLHFVLLKLWGTVAGTSEFSLRAFSFFCAVLAAAGLMALGRRVGGRWSAGWLAAAVFAVSQSFLYAAFEVRAYALALALFAWASVVLWELWERPRRYGLLLAAYLLLALALLYTHYTGFMALAAHGAYVGWWTLVRWERRQIKTLLHLGTGLVAGYIPWVVALAGRDVRAGTAYAGHIAPGDALRSYVDFYAFGQHLLPDDATPYLWAISLLVILSPLVWIAWRSAAARKTIVFALVMVVVPLAGLVVMVNAVQAKLSGRHGWAVWLGASLLVGMGLSALDRLRAGRWIAWAAALVIVWLPASTHPRPVYDSQLREAFATINQQAQPGDVLVLRDGTLFTAAGYYGASLPWIGLPPDKLTDVDRTLFFEEAVDSLGDLIDREDARRVWVVAWQGHIMDPQDLIAGILEYVGDSQPVPRSFGDVFVSLYALHERPQDLKARVIALDPVVQTPPDGPIYYGGYVLDKGPVPHGGAVLMHTWWMRGQTVMPGMRVSVRLYDSEGNFYTQIDQPPVVAYFGQEHWQPGSRVLSRFVLWVPYEMPSGPAEVKLLIYDMAGTFEPIPVLIDRITIQDP